MGIRGPLAVCVRGRLISCESTRELLTLSRRVHASCLSSRRLVSYLDRRGLDSNRPFPIELILLLLKSGGGPAYIVSRSKL